MNVKVSVIIPVYNADMHLKACVNSLINQTLKACEFIFINDGSTDNSQQIIESYQRFDDRVILFNKKNQGVSQARNKGLEIATGEYVGFVDADDFIEAGMYETLYNAAKQKEYDVIFSNFENEIDGHKVVTTYPFPLHTCLDKGYIRTHILPYLIENNNLNSACNKLYRNRLIKECSLWFPNNMDLGEDGLFNMQVLNKANSVFYLDYSGYHYREVNGSATRNIIEKNYFKRSLEEYKREVPNDLLEEISKDTIVNLKSIKLIDSVMSYIYVYLSAVKEMSLRERYLYVRKMVNNHDVQGSLNIYMKSKYNQSGRYEKVLIQMMKRKFTLGLYCITLYSIFRNKYGGILK